MRTVTYWLSLLVIFMIPWETLVVIPGFGSVSRFLGIFVGAFWLFTVLVTGKFRKIAPIHVFIFLFILWNALSVLWSIDPDETLTRLLTYVQMAVFSLIIWDLYSTPSAIRAGLQAYVLGLTVVIASTINNFLASSQTDYVLYGRYSASGSNANTTGILLAMGLPLAWYLASTAGDKKVERVLRLVNYAYIPMITFTMILTGTRFAIIMSLPAFIFGLGTLTRLKPGYRILIFILLAMALFSLGSKIPQASIQRLGTIDEEIQGGDLNDRTELWRLGLDFWLEHPILGIGSAGFDPAVEPIYGRPRALHNSFIAIAAELGIVGIVLFAIILVIAILQAWRHPTKWETWFWLTVLAAWCIGNLALTWVYSKPTWLLLSLLFASASLVRQYSPFWPDAELRKGNETTIPQAPQLQTSHNPLNQLNHN